MPSKEIVCFGMGNVLYGLRAEDIYQIIGGDYQITYLPNVKDYILGIISFEADIMPLLSLKKFFNIQSPEPPKARNIVILDRLDTKVALLIENGIDFIEENKAPSGLKLIRYEDLQR